MGANLKNDHTTYASPFMYTIMKIGQRLSPVSPFAIATVLMHCMVSTNQMNKLDLDANFAHDRFASFSPPPIFQSYPSGRMTGSSR